MYMYINVLLEIISSQSVINARECAKNYYFNNEHERTNGWLCVDGKKQEADEQKKIEPNVFVSLSQHTQIRKHGEI